MEDVIQRNRELQAEMEALRARNRDLEDALTANIEARQLRACPLPWQPRRGKSVGSSPP
jgi:hypothetical protein